MKKADTFNRARMQILNRMISFGIMVDYRMMYQTPTVKEYVFINDTPPIGALCSPTMVSDSKWYLSWLIEINPNGRMGEGCHEYLLKSIEDGQLCWFYNCQIMHLPIEKSEQNPSWKWSDKQFEFADKWKRVGKYRDEYITLTVQPMFNKDGSVILSTRERYSLSNYTPQRKFDNWKKVSRKEMIDFYDYAVANKPK